MTRRNRHKQRKQGYTTPFRKGDKTPARNDPCPCGSGMKYKKCHGAPPPPENRPRGSIYSTMRDQYAPEQKDAEKEFIKQWGFVPNPSQLAVFMQGSAQEMKDTILIGLKKLEAGPEYLYTVDKLNMLLTAKNVQQYSEEEQKLWDDTLEEYRRQNSIVQEEENAVGSEQSGDAGTV